MDRRRTVRRIWLVVHRALCRSARMVVSVDHPRPWRDLDLQRNPTRGRCSIADIDMSVSWDTFERYRQKGLDARRAGQWDSARVYLLEAARAMVELSKEARGEDLREARRQTATKLLELAKDCDDAKRSNRKS